MEYEKLKTIIKADVKSCILRDGRDPEECLDMAIEKYDAGDYENRLRKELGDKRY